jgi:hypothetical protein
MYPFAASVQPSIFSIQGHSKTYLIEASAGGRLTQAVRGDDFLRGEPRIDFIMINIEGHEPHAIEGMKETLAAHKPMVLGEFNPRCLQSFDMLFRYL